jgi:uncharacterized protein YbjQ (UPF0145 family)
MKKLMTTMGVAVALVATLVAGAAPALAADAKIMMPIAGAMEGGGAQERLGPSVRFYFADQPTPKVLERLGSDKTSQKTNAFGKAHETACNRVFLSGLLQLQKRAQQLGANAVIKIVSNYDNVEHASATEFECHVGMLMAGVAFKGEFVKVADK